MTFVSGNQGFLSLAAVDIGAYFRQLDVEATKDLYDTTCFGDEGHRWSLGPRGGSLSLEGFFDAAADAQFDSYVGGAALDNPEPFVYVPQGWAAGGGAAWAAGLPCLFGVGRVKSYKASSPANGMVTASVEIEAEDPGVFSGITWGQGGATIGGTTGQNWVGNQLYGVGAHNLDRGAGADTTNLKVAALLAVDLTSTGTQVLDVSLDHSADNVTYVNNLLGPARMGAGAAPPYQGHGIVVVNDVAAATVNRYLRLRAAASGGWPSTNTKAIGAVALWS